MRHRLAATMLVGSLLPAAARAAAPERQQCIDAHSQGQDLRDKGSLVEARDAFLLCAQSTCPSLVQADCAQFNAELSRLVPSVSFVARSPGGQDLPDTSVYIDEALVTQRLDGKTYEVNPGRHQLRLVHEGQEVRQELIVTQGEKGRPVVVTFAAPVLTAPTAPASVAPPPAVSAPVVRASHRPLGPLVVAIGGGALLVAGASLLLYGHSQIPDGCSLSSHRCVAAPDSSDLGDARRSVRTMNLGFGLGGAGAGVLAGGLLWYLLQPTEGATTSQALVPWVPPGGSGGGLLLHRRF